MDVIDYLLVPVAQEECERNEFGIMEMVEIRVFFNRATIYRRYDLRYALSAAHSGPHGSDLHVVDRFIVAMRSDQCDVVPLCRQISALAIQNPIVAGRVS